MPEVTSLKVGDEAVALSIEDGLLSIYLGDVLRGQVRVAEPEPIPFAAPDPGTYTDDKMFAFPNGWTLRAGVMYDENGTVIPNPDEEI